MIDTDKYEGHTPASWDCGSEEGLGIWKELFNGVCATPDNYGKKGYEERPIARMHITEGTAESDFNRMMADKQLMADAPLLLEEVKRLSRVLHAVVVDLTVTNIGGPDSQGAAVKAALNTLSEVIDVD